jgi:transcriptional regulator with XRE-family HTH domain
MRPIELARKSKLSSAQISRILSGERGAEGKTIRAIAQALGVPPEEVFEAAGFLPKPQAPSQDGWIRRVNRKLQEITNEDDRYTIEGLIDILSPEKKARRRRKAP